MNSGKEKYVNVQQPVPVLITYQTAWVDETGALQFREDVYGHDQALAVKMFTHPQAGQPMKAPQRLAEK